MNRLFVPTLGPTDWRRLLADPASQWEPRKSALEMAVCWEAARESARGLPPEVAAALDSTPDLRGAELVVGLPEHRVAFEGGGHPSQSDLWALLRCRGNFVSMAVEAKAGEKLDELVKDWLPKDSERSRKPERLAALQQRLAIPGADVSEIRYQLLHRTASALKEADRFRATIAAVLVQSFNREADEPSWQDFCRFGALLGASVDEGRFARARAATAVALFLGWVSSSPAGEDRLRAAV
jgi:uncharacterized protein DUF6946